MAKKSKGPSAAKPAWDYGRAVPPELWHHFWPAAAGSQQSPIAIVDCEAQPAALQPLRPQYKPFSLTHFFLEDLHLEIEVPPTEKPGGIAIGSGLVHKLAQFHIHTPSEHTVGGKYAAMELHAVHEPIASADYTKLVLAIHITGGGKKGDPLLAELIHKLPGLRVPRPKAALKLAPPTQVPTVESLFPADRSYYTYRGSLTTPECTEGVLWFVFKNSVAVPDAQIEAFAKYFPGGNNRPLQATNGRLIQRYDHPPTAPPPPTATRARRRAK